MGNLHRRGSIWVLLCIGISILWGISIGRGGNAWIDFRAVYAGTRCLIHQHNPYNVSDLEREYLSEDGQRPPDYSVLSPGHRALRECAHHVRCRGAIRVAFMGASAHPLDAVDGLRFHSRHPAHVERRRRLRPAGFDSPCLYPCGQLRIRSLPRATPLES